MLNDFDGQVVGELVRCQARSLSIMLFHLDKYRFGRGKVDRRLRFIEQHKLIVVLAFLGRRTELTMLHQPELTYQPIDLLRQLSVCVLQRGVFR